MHVLDLMEKELGRTTAKEMLPMQLVDVQKRLPTLVI